MRKLFLFPVVALLAACGGQQEQASEPNMAAAETEAPATSMSLHETTWAFSMDGKQIQESIDGSGNYIANAGDEHFDHGTYAMVDGKQCFTSAMSDDGQVCWTAPANIEIGESVEIANDKGEKLTVTRQEYVPLTMPS
jgi:streptogramin lyase